jgi:sugar lactone lactonase YvrE
MTFPNRSRQIRLLLLLGFAVCGLADGVLAQDRRETPKPLDFQFEAPWNEAAPPALPPVVGSDDAAEPGHRHLPIDVDARPIVRRYHVNLNRPRRVILDPAGAMLIADWADGTIVKVDPDGDATLFATDLNEPAGLALDRLGNLYVANHGGGMMQQGNILKISADGDVLLFAENLNGPTALAFDAQGDLFVSEFHANRILRITPAGIVHLVADTIPTPAALAFDINGYLYAASSTEGAVYRISPMGNVEQIARGLSVPSDLAFDPEQHLIVTNFGGTELTYIDPFGKTKIFAMVPKGTIGIQFDLAGTLVFVNWDYQTLMKVTTNLTVPCPHCEKPIPLRLRPRQKPKPNNGTVPKSTGPII